MAAQQDERSWTERLGQYSADAAVNPLTYGVGIAISLFVVKVLGERDFIVFALAAFPVVGLTALSKSPIGAQVVKSLEAKLPGGALLVALECTHACTDGRTANSCVKGWQQPA